MSKLGQHLAEMASSRFTKSVHQLKINIQKGGRCGAKPSCGAPAAFQLSRLLGLLPYTHSAELRLTSPSFRQKYAYSNYWAVYSIILATAYMITVVATNYDYLEGGKRRGDDWITNVYNLMIYLTKIGLQGLTLVVHLYKVTFRRKKLAAIFRDISEIRIVAAHSIFSTGMCTVIAVCCVVGCHMTWMVIKSSHIVPWFIFMCPMISDMICTVVVMQFCAVLIPVERGFARVTAALKVGGPKSVHPLINLHSLLIRKAVSINKFYSAQLMFVMSLAVINYIGWAYFAVESIVTDEPDYLLGGSQSLLAVYQIFLILYTCRSCSSVTKEASLFNDELYRMSTRYTNMSNKVKVTLYMRLRKTVEFTGCGFFTFNYPLVGSILGTGATYIVILVQFSMLQEATTDQARELK